jgi:hypothetical protein
MAMSKIIKEKWINALNSGEYKQTKRCLYDGDGYCCLGVLCAITGNRNNRDMSEGFPKENANGDAKPFIGLTVKEQEDLAGMNDQGFNFKSIAEYISRNIKVK